MFNLSNSHNLNLLAVYKKAKKIYDEGLIFRKQKRRERVIYFLKRFSFAVISLAILFAILLSVHFVNFLLIYRQAKDGQENIDKAILLLEKHDNQGALRYAKLAQADFETSLGFLSVYENNFLVKNFDFFQAQFDDFVYLFSTAEILSRGAEKAAATGLNFDKILAEKTKFSELSETERRQILQFIYESAPELYGIKANIDLAAESLQNIKYVGLLRPFKHGISGIGTKLKVSQFLLAQSVPMSQILPALFGYPDEANFLVVFQDNSDLRATGGVVRAFGILKSLNGEIVSFKTYDASRLDQAIEKRAKISPPLALRKYKNIENWSVSEANWSPDWPISAAQIRFLYEKEFGKELKIDGVIAVNLDLLKDFLALTSTLSVNGRFYAQGNIKELFNSGAPKEDFGDLIIEIKKKIFDQNITSIYNAINLLAVNLAKKNLLISFTDQGLATIAEEQNWQADIKAVDGDYLMMVDSNLSGPGQDLYISRNIGYSVEYGLNGASVDLRINYANRLPFSTDDYKTYLRVYVPLGSELILAKGFGADRVETSQEADKTVFSGPVSVSAGKISNLRLYYRLPAKINKMANSGKYVLYVQKQPGVEINSFTVDVTVQNSIKLYNPIGFSVYRKSDKELLWETDLLTDRIFTVEF